MLQWARLCLADFLPNPPWHFAVFIGTSAVWSLCSANLAFAHC